MADEQEGLVERWRYRQEMRAAGEWEPLLALPTRQDYTQWQDRLEAEREAERQMLRNEQQHLAAALVRQQARDNGISIELAPVLGFERQQALQGERQLPDTKRDRIMADLDAMGKTEGPSSWQAGLGAIPEPAPQQTHAVQAWIAAEAARLRVEQRSDAIVREVAKKDYGFGR